MTTHRWYIFETTVPGDRGAEYEITSWSRTLEAARAKVEEADPGRDGLAFKVFAADRQQATLDAMEVWGVKVKGYISPEARRMGRMVVKSAVMREIFCPWTGQVLDMRRAVVIATPTESFVCSAAHWDAAMVQYGGLDAFRDIISRKLGRPAQVNVYDGRELFKR
jgi:hypothetical protein